MAFNTTKYAGTDGWLWGGTGLTVMEDTLAQKKDSGVDPTGLGRWSWIRLLGKQGEHVRLISAYRPVKSNRIFSVWNQHYIYFEREEGERVNPQTRFLQDLCHAITLWQDGGDHIILGMDANEDVREGTVTEALAELGLAEATATAHTPSSPPATCKANLTRTPIDGIWISPSVQVTRCGYLGYDEGPPSDNHRVVWIDIDNESILGHRPPQLAPKLSKRLRTKDPRIIKRYIQQTKQALT
jgi:hypothetical protein